ncbi:MAG: hypothetical protein H0U39_02145 [Segetibacter sp.]|nr:hypothetical protein [Segetibacter sp.]
MNKKLVEGEDFYYNEAGLIVMKESYHIERGFCCGNGCRHCPFKYENVPEPQRTELLYNKENRKPE